MKIGILDSNLSGLVIVEQIIRSFTDHRFVYYADTLLAPYDDKRPATIIKGARQATRMLLQRKVEAVVVVCPVMSAVALNQIRADAELPVFDVVTAAVDQALKLSKHRRFGLIAPQTAIDTGAYERRIHQTCPEAFVCAKSADLLPHLIDADWTAKPETRMIVKKYLHPLKVQQIDTLILACNHAVLLEKLVQAKAGKRITLASAIKPLWASLNGILSPTFSISPPAPSKPGDIELMASEVTERHRLKAQRFLKQKIPLLLHSPHNHAGNRTT